MEQYLDNCFSHEFNFDFELSSESSSSSDNYSSTSAEDKCQNQFDFEQSSSTSLDEYFNSQYGFDFQQDEGASLNAFMNNQYGFDFEQDYCTTLDEYLNNQFDADGSCSSMDTSSNESQLELCNNQAQPLVEPVKNSSSKIPLMMFWHRETMRYHKTPEQLAESKDQLTKELLYNSIDHIMEYDEQELSDIKRLRNHIEANEQMDICRELEASIDDIDEQINKFHELEAQLELIF